jgi:flagellar capping protein FliD
MGSPITFSGLNNIHFGSILTAIMAAERAPLTALETQRTALNQKGTAFTTLASKLGALRSAIADLTDHEGVDIHTAASGSPERVDVSTTGGGVAGIREVGVVTAYNDLMAFIADQDTAAAAGQTSIARDSLVRQLKMGLTGAMRADYAGSGTDDTRLSTIGVEFDRTGTIVLDSARLKAAVLADPAAVRTICVGVDGTGGAFGALDQQVREYTQAGGLVQGAKNRLKDQIGRIDARLDSMELQLELRRSALQQKFIAADRLMSQLNGQGASLQALGGQYRLF